jgi:hypothetical protein
MKIDKKFYTLHTLNKKLKRRVLDCVSSTALSIVTQIE